MLYYKKTVTVIHAIQLTETNIQEVGAFIGEHKNYPNCEIGGIEPTTGNFRLRTAEGPVLVAVGNYIVRKQGSSNFVYWPKDTFEKIYSPAE